MVIKFIFIVFLTFMTDVLHVKAQFYTVFPSEESIEFMSGYKEDDYVYVDENQRGKSPITQEDTITFFSQEKGKAVKLDIDVPIFVNAYDSLLLCMIHDRLNVCLPLDFLKVNSRYGWRTDPINKCHRFHDGIDLQCNYENVYSMLPGIISKVVYGKKGYGNYIVINHGNIECLYGHLSLIAVSEGDNVTAGTIVGISGNTGKSTGPHLHIQITKNGKSIDPTPFIAYLNKYINDLQSQLHALGLHDESNKELSITNLYAVLNRHDVKHKEIVLAQALLETGYFSSRVCLENNNLFGLRRPSNGKYYKFANWEESVKAYRDYVQYKYKGGDYYSFLNKIGYAEDSQYINKLRKIVNSIEFFYK
ncbi:MAG: peptidoglycan DD-metalloendopeptidase family protein [Prevotella sp.]|nr:peptidoglycan DD-metalloendopeptidase family protein [Prevotella sp.]